MVENIMEVFMDDFSVVGNSFNECLANLTHVLKRCIEMNLVLNWEKCHFMVQEGIVLGHLVSSKGIEVDRAKVVVIEKLPPPTSVKAVLLDRVEEFDLEIRDLKGTKNQVADHLSRLEGAENATESEDILETFLDEQLLATSVEDVPWYADIANYLACDIEPYELSYVQKK
ncbi:uncharacterized protein [Nicotiana sylvestris]|uniref:uncharacterized protein n=1 Tax=Nicotiana sylvestris TaxID=4096 RepID=UPI00388CB4BE